MVLVRVLLFIALGAIAIAAFLYFYRRDRRYLRFIVQTIKFSIILGAIVLVYFAAERLMKG